MSGRRTIVLSFDTNFPILSTLPRSSPLGLEPRLKMERLKLLWPCVPMDLLGLSLTMLVVSNPLQLKGPVLQARVNAHLETQTGLQTVHHHSPVNLLYFLRITIAPHPSQTLPCRLGS
jgi:hypothetical protein